MDKIIIQNLFNYMSLDQQTAIHRAKLIRPGSISYNFHIILEPTLYHGLAEIAFYLETVAKEDLLLDFSGGEVQALIVNDLEIDYDDDGRENFINLPKACLQKGRNRVSVMYNSEFNNDLSGLISFNDHGQQFLYTDFEPYGANRVFPCFDQPNLKAYMNLTVIGPEVWRILSHEHPISNESFRAAKYVKNSKWDHSESKHLLDAFSKKVINVQNSKLTVFPQTKLLPSYIFCFCAGNYQQIKSTQGTVSMSLFCIPDAFQKLERYSKLIFKVTIKCMDFYEGKFGIKFPFNKYDQIFIREFGAFAMQNAGIVTFDEKKMLPDNPTQYDYYISSLVVSHELSHHWFGDYVTMVWWDDLWLNESFAEWMSCYSLESLKGDLGFESYSYFRDGKNSGYKDDERNNATHPIRGTVANTDEAFSIFDGITYEKGASVLKQLTFLVDDSADHTKFFKALQSFFLRFPWGNATIHDLLVDIGKYFPESAGSLDDWKKKWLQTASLNVFDVDWDQQNSKITLKQTSFNDSGVLRAHKLKIALFDPKGTFKNIDAFINSESTEITYEGGPYSAILVNNEDWTFAENNIDPISLQFFRNNIDKIDNLFTRLMIWYNFRSMVNLSRILITEYIDFIKQKLFIEDSNFILEKILENLYFFLSKFIKKPLGNAYRSSICELIYQQLQIIDDTSTQRIQILQNNYIEYSHTQEEINGLWAWLNELDPKLKNRPMNQDQKWNTVLKIFTLNIDTAQKWDVFNQVKNSDKSASRIQDYNTIVAVLAADEEQFQAVYQQFKKSEVSLSVKYLKAAGWNNDYHSKWIVDKYLDRYFNDIVQVSQTLSFQEFQFFYTDLRPIDCDLSTEINKYNQVISKLKELGGMDEHIRNLKKFIDDISLRIQNISFNSDMNLALSQARAIHRYTYIQAPSISYNFHLAFVKEVQYYEGLAQINFILNTVPSALPVDCVCDTIYAVNVNQKLVEPTTDGEFLFVMERYLKVGRNTLTIRYRNKYNNDGSGCMSYIQTVGDRAQYNYTNFEPYGAHRFVPCFDQPDFRVSAQFNVIVPEGWIAVGNQKEQYQGDFSLADYKAKVPTQNPALLDAYLKDKQGYFYEFAPTKPISTYLYCIAVGEYYQKVVDESKLYRNIPMSLYCIKSYKDRLERMANFIVEMTTLSLELFQQKFDTPYQFNKYDTIFCHEYKPGAMQNPGLITFKDTYLYPEQVSIEKMLALASTIIHENSHNWFGDYVTMKWWDDLWLNESFADFIAHYGLEKLKDKVTTIPKYDSGWKIFLVRGVAGYREDQITETTHAVRSVVENTSVAATYFDRITYQKGSATLKQFMFLMGEDKFFNGIQNYFKEFGWKNATIDDFLSKMQPYFTIPDFTLDEWKSSWLLTPSLNTVSIDWHPEDISETAVLTINQKFYSSEYPTLRYHKTKVAFFYSDGNYDVQEVLLTPTDTTTLTYNGSNNYKAILVNYDYWSYFKYTIDQVSLDFFEENLNNINHNPTDVLTRMIIWHDINEQVRDANYTVSDYITTLRKFIFDETDDKIFQFEFSFVRDALNNYISIPQRSGFKTQIFEAIYEKLKSLPAKKGNDLPNRIILLKDQLSVFATLPSQVELLENWRIGNNPDLKRFPITVSQAWEVVKLIFAVTDYTPAIKDQTYLDQYNKTPGIQGQLVRNTCDALIADATKFESIFSSFEQMDLSLDAKESFASGWNSLVHLEALKNAYKSRYFLDLPLLSRSLVSNHFQFFYQNLKPIDDDLAGTIASYEKVKLQGSENLGHVKVLTQIKYGYQLRQALYDCNR